MTILMYNPFVKGDGYMYYLLLAFASVLLAADFALNKIYQKENGTSYEAGYRFNTLMGLFTAIIFLAANRFEFEFTWYSCIMAFLMTVFATSYNLIGFRLLKDGSMAMYTLFLMAGGMVVPYAVGIAFLHEQITLMRIFALVLILAGVIIPNCTAKDFNKKHIAMYVTVFFLNGMVSVVSKLHQMDIGFEAVSTSQYVCIKSIIRFLSAGAIYLCIKSKNHTPCQRQRRFSFTILVVLLSSIVSGGSYFLQLVGAANLPASVLYPFVTGGSIVFSSVTGVILFKEKLSSKLIISLGLCTLGTIMFL